MLCFVVVMQSFIMNSHEVFIHIHQGCFAGTGAIVRLPQCQWSKPDGYGKISQYITTTKHSKAKTACIFLGIYYMRHYGGGVWGVWEMSWYIPRWTHYSVNGDTYLTLQRNLSYCWYDGGGGGGGGGCCWRYIDPQIPQTDISQSTFL